MKNNSFELEGTLIQVGQIQEFGKEKKYDKRDFVVLTDEKFPQKVRFELYRDNCDLIDAYKVGDKLSVSFNVRGNDSGGRFFVNLHAWKVQPFKAEATATSKVSSEEEN